jgi:acetoacetyl-CoA synthetase
MRLDDVELDGISALGGRYDHIVRRLTILSTGSPLTEENFKFVYSHIKNDFCLSSISGGTDINGCFALGNPMGPVYAGELQCRGLAMNVQAYDEEGKPHLNRKGELVCTSPFPSMPISFWNDPDGKNITMHILMFTPVYGSTAISSRSMSGEEW